MGGHGDKVERTQASEFLFSTGKLRRIPSGAAVCLAPSFLSLWRVAGVIEQSPFPKKMPSHRLCSHQFNCCRTKIQFKLLSSSESLAANLSKTREGAYRRTGGIFTGRLH